ncbi:MAG: hypothetical protein ACT4QD_01590 [Acidobacteriota bacterium]
MKIGGGGTEKFMIAIPLFVGLVLSIYALGGPERALILMEQLAQDTLDTVRNALR